MYEDGLGLGYRREPMLDSSVPKCPLWVRVRVYTKK